MQRFLRVGLAVLLAAILCCSTALADFDAVTNSSAKVYAGPSTSAGKLVLLPKGMGVTVTGFNGGWAQISCGGNTGYCALSCLTSVEREKAYVQGNTYLYASASTSSKLCSVSKGAKVYWVASAGNFFLVQNPSNGSYGYIPAGYLGKSAPASASSSSSGGGLFDKSKVVMVKWYSGGSSVLKKGSYGYIYDIASGILMKIKRMGGSAHMDIEPATSEDTSKLRAMYGGTFSWDSRAVILIAGGAYVAAAINGYPHGDQTITDNNYDGQFCLHLTGSHTHGSDTVNEAHQANILRAYAWAHG